jgi:Polyketide cyclase / dehydrase and lipid transport
MIRLSGSVCIDAPAELVWARLAKLEDIELWSHLIKRATCPGERSRGVGAERTCELAGNITILERWVAWDEGRSFAYEGTGLPLVKRARNVWSVHPRDRAAVFADHGRRSLAQRRLLREAARAGHGCRLSKNGTQLACCV